MNALLAIVNLLTVIANAILSLIKSNNHNKEKQRLQSESEKLHEDPGKYIADMFGTRNNNSVRSEEQANKDIYYANKTSPKS